MPLLNTHVRGIDRDLFLRDCSAQDFDEIKHAAEKEDAEAQSSLGMMYLEGLGIARNDAEALKWFRMTERGN